MSFKNVHYNYNSNTITLWENTEGGGTKKISLNPDIEYYIPDSSGKSPIKDIWGNSVKIQTSKTIKDMKSFVSTANIKTCEASISQDIKFLQKRYGDDKLKANIDDFQVATIDIELESGDDFPDDIAEIVPYPINLISVHYSKENKIYTFGNREYTGDSPSVKHFHYCADEKTLLERFIAHFRKQKVDILTGWNSKLFDMTYFINRANLLGVELSLSPINKYQKYECIDDFKNKRQAYKIAGISILDGQELYKKYISDKEVSYSLNAIGLAVCKEGKLDLDGQVNHIYKTDWNKFVEYNVQDVNLTRKIEVKKKFIDLSIQFCYQALIPFENVFSSISITTGYMLNYMHKKNIVLPDPSTSVVKEQYPGGYVMAQPGFYEYVLSYDVESLYPHMIMMYNISPETLRLNPTDTTGLIKTPASEYFTCETPKGKFEIEGVYYAKDKKGILPEIVETIFNDRKYFKDKMKIATGIDKRLTPEEISKNTRMNIDYVNKLYAEVKEEGYSESYYYDQQQIRKILINSMYGVLGNKNFTFYNTSNAAAITVGGRHMIQFLSNKINEYMKEYWHIVARKFYDCGDRKIPQIKKDVVVLIDTDSNYLCLSEVIEGLGLTFATNEDFRLWANDFDKRFCTPFFNKILEKYAAKFNAPQLINFKREKIITKKVILKKKKYADYVIDKEGDVYDEPFLDITGIEIVKTSTPKFCRKYLKETLAFMMNHKDKDKTTDLIRGIYDDFMDASVDDISYPRSVNNYSKYSEHITEYLKNGVKYIPSTPQHVKGAINYNYIISKYDLKLQAVGNGAKIKYIKVLPNKNEINTDVVAYIHTYPKEFNELFKIDKEGQWVKSFQDIIQRFYVVFGWGNVVLDRCTLEDFIEF